MKFNSTLLTVTILIVPVVISDRQLLLLSFYINFISIKSVKFSRFSL